MFTTLLLALVLQSASKTNDLSSNIQSQGIKEVRLLSGGGDIRVRAVRGDSISLSGSRTLGGVGCKVSGEVEKKNQYVFRARDPSGAPCRIDINLAVPPQMRLHLESDEGNVFVSGLRNALEVVLGQGNAVLGGTFPHLSAQLAQGSLSVQGLAGSAELELQQGNAQLWYGPKPRGTAEINVEHGNVTITAPVKALNLAATVEAGKCTNPLDNSPEAPLKISGRIGHGNLTVRPGASK